MIRLFIIVQIFFSFLFSTCLAQENIVVLDLRCENLRNPLGIDKTMPRFSWKIQSDKQGTEQKAFQVLVASDVSLLDKNRADLWNSGKIVSSNNIMISYKGKVLNSGSVVFWKVRIWDESGHVSSWSPVSEFSIGLLNKQDWRASYIGFPQQTDSSECPQLKKSFNVENIGKRVFLYVNSLGYHEVYLNGKKVGNNVLAPAVSQFNKRSLVIVYDVSSLVRKGRNDLILWLGNGWYSEGLPGVVNKSPLVKAQLEQLTGMRRKIILVTDSSWVGKNSEYTRIGLWRANHFGGEQLDGRLAKNGLSVGKYNTPNWSPVSVVSVPEHEVSPQMVEGNIIQETLKPVKISSLSDKTFLIDMGKSLTGWLEIHFPKLQKSQKVVLEYCDHMKGNGDFVDQRQVDRYIASGETPEVFKDKFNYHGFRYVRVSNLDEAPSLDSIRAYLIHPDYGLGSKFECSDSDLNKIHDMIYYTLRCLSLGGYLVDCPQLERLGYGGDGNASTMTAQTMFNLAPLYRNWLQAWGDCVREDGGMPHTAPNPYAAGGGPYWCGFIITASWNTFMNYGDLLILQKSYPVMQKWLGYVDKYSVDGLLKRWPDNDYRNWYLGDWATPKGVDQTSEASVDLVNNCSIVVCYDKMRKIAKLLGKDKDAELYLQKENQLRAKIQQTYFDKINNSYATGSQIDLTYPMLANVIPDELVATVTKRLVDRTKNEHNGHFATGLVGIPVLTEWAVKNQETELMYTMLKAKGYPGYLNMIDNGATTTWEHWDGQRSWIHNCYNGIGSWFYQALGGIRLVEDAPAYRKILIQPQVPQAVNWAKTSKETPYGTIVVNWEVKGKTMEMELEIPVGIEAGVVIPAGIKNYKIEGNDYGLSGEKPSTVNIKSGKCKISYTM
ncbi:MAG: family 78 glycoside hydrolase catalytic domain [Bacteroidetes bacterium]|nr:family 78 glycoside hydrolase catalytic domain [Bacteroidota bacterium]